MKAVSKYSAEAGLVLHRGDCLTLLRDMPDQAAKLIVTSPPYNLGKEYESRLDLEEYLVQQRRVITECVRILHQTGSICWQVGNYVDNGEIVPLDVKLYPIFESLGLRMRNRIIWHFGHGLHASRRFSGRYETIMWFTRSNAYTFNLDDVRVPQKYPEKKHFKGPKTGEYSCNPLGKNPTDIWDIPNVKANHVEKTEHPCQFPVELVERLVLSLTNPGDLVFDPFMGVGSSAIAALMHQRRAAGAEIVPEYLSIAKQRIRDAATGKLRVRPMEREVYDPQVEQTNRAPRYVQLVTSDPQLKLLEKRASYGARKPKR